MKHTAIGVDGSSRLDASVMIRRGAFWSDFQLRLATTKLSPPPSSRMKMRMWMRMRRRMRMGITFRPLV
jgi:hypothetical protein